MKIQEMGGSIMFNISKQAVNPGKNFGPYGLAKTSTLFLMKQYALECGQYNIRVNAIAPGLTNTDMMRENTPKEVLNEMISRISLKRIASPEEIANVALLLSSDLSSYVTGQVIRVDGGM